MLLHISAPVFPTFGLHYGERAWSLNFKLCKPFLVNFNFFQRITAYAQQFLGFFYIDNIMIAFDKKMII